MLITNFASGELSQNLNGRVDIQQYYQGAARIENFDIIPTGGIRRRPGTQRIAELSDNNRIIPFIVNKDYVYILELGLNPSYDPAVEGSKKGLLSIWRKGALGNFSVIQTIETDYQSLYEMRDIQYAQNYDTLVLVHKDYKPMQLTRNAQGVFTLAAMEFNFIPEVELDDDFDFVMICSRGLPVEIHTGEFSYYTIVNGQEQYITKAYSAALTSFYCISGGKLYKWEGGQWVSFVADVEIEEQFNQATRYPSCVAFFNNRLFFASTREHIQRLWASAAPDDKGTRYTDFATYKKYVTVNRTTKEADMHVFTCDINPADVSGGHTTLRNVTQDLTGGLKRPITEYFITGGTIPVGTKVISVTPNTMVINTDQIVFPEEVIETTTGEQTTSTTVTKPIQNLACTIQLWRSSEVISADDYDFIAVANNITTADCSLFFELASDQNDAIKFLSSNRFLAVGTESSIWSIDPGISALSINAVMQGRYGSDSLQGQAVETATVYFAQGNKGIREFYYDGESKAFRTNNIALLADHILRESAVVDFDYMTNPYSRLIIVRSDGVAACMLYDKTNGIMAWSRFIHGKGKIRNCAVTRGDDENDLVFFVVQEGSGAEARYFMEELDLGTSFYIDSWKVYDATAQDPTDGYTDGAILWNKTKDNTCPYDNIPDGFIEEGDEVYIGYDFTSYIKSMPVVAGELSKRQRIANLYVRFLNSYLPVVKVADLPNEKFTTITQLPYSGVGKVNYPGSTDRDVCFELKAGGIKSVNILSVEAQTV